VTIGVEFGSYGLRIDDKIIKLQIWDTVSAKMGRCFGFGCGFISSQFFALLSFSYRLVKNLSNQ